MNNLSKVTVLINSCDLYKDAWEPCLELMHKQWQNCPTNIAINTETIKYSGKYNNVKTITAERNNLTWSQRFRRAIEKVETPYILFTLEDYFILSEVNHTVFESGVNLLDQNKDIGMICMSHTQRENIKTNEFENEYFYSRKINPECKIWCRINLYRKEFLLEILRDHENIWEFEKYAAYRAKQLNYIILQQNSQSSEIFNFNIKIEDGYGITQRKWLSSNVELFKKHNIKVNYDGLGIYTEITDTETAESRKNRNFIEVLYKIKKFPYKIKRKMIKNFRIYKSKH